MTQPRADEQYDLGRMSEDEAPQALELINLVQPHVPWSMEHFRWQYFGNPAGPAALYVARHEGRVVSFYAGVLQTLQVGERTVSGVMVQDVMTHPEHRGHGLLHRLAAICLDELRSAGRIGYAFPNEQSVRSFVRNGWHEPASVPWWALREPVVNPTTVDAKEVLQFDSTATEIWDDAALVVAVRRDADYLNWRYSKPGQSYFRFVVPGVAVIVMKLFFSGATAKGHVCEVFARRTHTSRVKELLQFATSWCAARGAGSVTAWMPYGHPYAGELAAAGFEQERSVSRSIVVTAPAHLERVVDDPANWYLTQGDSDVY